MSALVIFTGGARENPEVWVLSAETAFWETGARIELAFFLVVEGVKPVVVVYGLAF